MAQDSEKRFHQIMDKLFTPSKSQLPSSSTSSPVEQQSRGKKRPNPSSALALVEPKTGLASINRSSAVKVPVGSSPSGLCRPWDRGDLMRRLATFKSMTWFAKPQVISAVNCARRGWVNDDADSLACQSCGAHLYFSAPSSWSKQQVEKAASVFSLKLDSGHKLLCPWIENSCEETLSEFPSMTPQDLVDRHEERSEALLQLLALPIISPSAIEYMRSSDLEEFLKRPIAPACGDTAAECSQTESLINHVGASPAQLFYQAQKLISLCGWEPRALPYIVDCKDKSSETARGTDTIDLLPETATRELLSISNSTPIPNGISGNNENPRLPDTLNSDPSSVVLDCKLCGACVGLWVFSTVPRPLELCRVTGDTEVNAEKNHRGGTFQNQTSSLNFTIAGGPPATKQNFKATISLPIIGRNLRSRFASYSRDHDHGDVSSIQDQQSKTAENNGGVTENSDQVMNDIGEKADGGRNSSDMDSDIALQTKDKQMMVERSILPENNKLKDSTAGKSATSNKQMEFDPIKQHRHFCPWIWSTGRRGPGWRQTLSALQRHKGSCQTPPSPSSLFKEEELGRPVSIGEVFIKTHTTDRSYVDLKAKEIVDIYEKNLEEKLSQLDPSEISDGTSRVSHIPAEETNDLFIQSSIPDRRGTKYGLGSLAPLVKGSMRNHPEGASNQAYNEVREELLSTRRKLAETKAELAEYLGKFKSMEMVLSYIQADPKFIDFVAAQQPRGNEDEANRSASPRNL